MNGCSCERCLPDWWGMRVCLACGDKRCGRAVDHDAVCGPAPDRDEAGERGDAMTGDDEFRRLLDRSSFGTPEAKAAMASVPDTAVAKVLARVEELERAREVARERERARRIRLAAEVTREAQAVAGAKLDTYRRHYATTDEDLKRTAFAHGAAWAVHYLAGKGLLDLPDEGDPTVADSGGVARPYDPFGETR